MSAVNMEFSFFIVMASVIILSVIMLSVIVLSVIVLCVIVLSVIMVSVIMLSVILLSVIMQCRHVESRGASSLRFHLPLRSAALSLAAISASIERFRNLQIECLLYPPRLPIDQN